MRVARRLRIVYTPLSEILAWPTNPKTHDRDGISGSIDRWGFNDPMVIDERTGRLVEGHGRAESLSAMKAEGKTPPAHVELREGDGEWLAPVVRGVAFASDEEAEGYIVAHNGLTTAGGWEQSKLAPILARAMESRIPAGVLGFEQAAVDKILVAAHLRLPPDITGGPPDGDRYKEQYGVIVICANEAEQARVYEQLRGLGFSCRVVVT